ncbi:hypothetical protein KC19_11G044000 [Ceratodon purpureus]|uniref:Secreted protein n=1 Tax=Ceratodon purpureus TaxID=3225 RepID=A0A8T0GAY8_CERPU|nr:hypothetical protein KC19_11G044000 [Ceratodon purpureus]
MFGIATTSVVLLLLRHNTDTLVSYLVGYADLIICCIRTYPSHILAETFHDHILRQTQPYFCSNLLIKFRRSEHGCGHRSSRAR